MQTLRDVGIIFFSDKTEEILIENLPFTKRERRKLEENK